MEVVVLTDPKPTYTPMPDAHPAFVASFRLRLVNHRTDRKERIVGGAIVIKKTRLRFWKRDLLSIPAHLSTYGISLDNLELDPQSRPLELDVYTIVQQIEYSQAMLQGRLFLVLNLVGPIRRIVRPLSRHTVASLAAKREQPVVRFVLPLLPVSVASLVGGEWAYLRIKNDGREEAEFEVQMQALRGTGAQEIPYHIPWRYKGAAQRRLKAGDEDRVNVVEQEKSSSTNRCRLRFYSADSPDGQPFIREVPHNTDIDCQIAVFAQPPLPDPWRGTYRLHIGDQGEFESFIPL